MTKDEFTVIGKRIRECRLEKRMSQSQLGSLLAVSQDTVSLWEKSKSIPPAEIIIELTKIFDVSSDYLLGLAAY